jgi:release factor glutamine methyltransferase
VDGLVERLRAAGCVFAEDEAALLVAERMSPADLEDAVRRRVAGEPLEHVLGWVDVAGTRIVVAPGVFVPRRRTQVLVTAALQRSADLPAPAVLVELCCGAAAVGTLLAARVPGVELHVADVDPNAIACARENVAAVGGHAHLGDLYDALPVALRGRVDVLVANAPYVPTAAIVTMPPEARDHEPRLALDGGPDGLDVQRRVVAQAPDWLTPSGWLLVETSQEQASGTMAAFRAAGLTAEVVRDDDVDGTAVAGRPVG